MNIYQQINHNLKIKIKKRLINLQWKIIKKELFLDKKLNGKPKEWKKHYFVKKSLKV